MSTNVADKDYKQLQQSVSKALTAQEIPLKEKHARATIIGTYRFQGTAAFWSIAMRQPIMENRISAWKFCHLLHKILREGHNLCCQESQRNVKYLTDLGKLWSHLTDGYGICILQYTKLLTLKIEFHIRNPRFPGTLKLSRSEIEQIGGGDINVIFQLTIEIFDYLDALIGLQATVFNSLNTCHVNFMTLAGQCRLAALIPCIEDAEQLYNFALQFMFQLHVHLPHDILDGHRNRFTTIFKHLRPFYQQLSQLQYFVDLVTVPKLPDQLPNFQQNSEIYENQTEYLVVPENSFMMALMAKNIMVTDVTDVNEHEQPKPQQSNYFDQLACEPHDLSQQSEEKIQNHNSEILEMEEKFEKLMSLYMETREDHVNLLRQHQETNNAMNEMRQSYQQLYNNKTCIENELTELKKKYETNQELLQKIISEKLNFAKID